MDAVSVFNRDLELIGIIDVYTSLIWANRFNQVGDCELYLPATTENLILLQSDFYLTKTGSDMVCQIKKIELDTNAENGNYLIVTGYDVKRWLDQRIIWGTMTADGNAETFARSLVDGALGGTADDDRQVKDGEGRRMFYLGDPAGFTEVLTEQVSYKTVGEKIREYCTTYKWGYRVQLVGWRFVFELYKGEDRSASVTFSDTYDNLAETKYTEDYTKLGNVALVGGAGEGAERALAVSGEGAGIDRYEIFVDAKNVSRSIKWAELREIYPTVTEGGSGYIAGSEESGWVYKVRSLDVQIVDDAQMLELMEQYPEGTLVEIGGVLYYNIPDATVADLPSETPKDNDAAELRDVVYTVYLLTRGYEKIAEYGTLTSFTGSVEPNTTFIYNRDYFLGDYVTVRNEYGITVKAQITEVVEVNDDNGFSVQPKFEFINNGG